MKGKLQWVLRSAVNECSEKEQKLWEQSFGCHMDATSSGMLALAIRVW